MALTVEGGAEARAPGTRPHKVAARLLLGLITASIILVGPQVAPARPAAAYTARAATMNICSASCHVTNSQKFRTLFGQTFLRNSVFNQGANSPWTIGATEVCGLTHVYLDSEFSSYRSDFFQTLSYHSACQGNFGDSLYTVGYDIGGPSQWKFTAGTYNSGSIPPEARSIGCQEKLGYGFNWSACVVHIATSSVADRVEQSGEARYITGSRTPNLIVSGDFNLQPSSNTPWPTIWEGDGTFFPTASLNTTADSTVEIKYDYNYAPIQWFPGSYGSTSCGTSQSRYTTAQYSDHCYLNATFAN